MYKIEFGGHELSALEIRDPLLQHAEEVAKTFDIYWQFNQQQQMAFTRHGEKRRIGNGKHKVWSIDFLADPPNVRHPARLGRLAIQSHVDPARMLFGGFDYGPYEGPYPTYRYIHVVLPSEISEHESWLNRDPEPAILEACLSSFEESLTAGQYPLF